MTNFEGTTTTRAASDRGAARNYVHSRRALDGDEQLLARFERLDAPARGQHRRGGGPRA